VGTHSFQVPVDEAFRMQVDEALAYVQQLKGVSATSCGRHGLLARSKRLKVGFFLTKSRTFPFSIHGDTRHGCSYSIPVILIPVETPYKGNRFR